MTWTGTNFQTDGEGYGAIQDNYGNLWDKGGVYGLTLVDQDRGLQVSLGEEGTQGPNIYLGSGTGTGVAFYRDFAFDDYWVLNKYLSLVGHYFIFALIEPTTLINLYS